MALCIKTLSYLNVVNTTLQVIISQSLKKVKQLSYETFKIQRSVFVKNKQKKIKNITENNGNN